MSHPQSNQNSTCVTAPAVSPVAPSSVLKPFEDKVAWLVPVEIARMLQLALSNMPLSGVTSAANVHTQQGALPVLQQQQNALPTNENGAASLLKDLKDARAAFAKLSPAEIWARSLNKSEHTFLLPELERVSS
jgi:hypothetical protein